MSKFLVLSGADIEPQKMLMLLGKRQSYTLGELIKTLDGEPSDSLMYIINRDWKESKPVLEASVYEVAGRNRVVLIRIETSRTVKHLTVGDLRTTVGKSLMVEIMTAGDHIGPYEYNIFSIERTYNGIQLRCGEV